MSYRPYPAQTNRRRDRIGHWQDDARPCRDSGAVDGHGVQREALAWLRVLRYLDGERRRNRVLCRIDLSRLRRSQSAADGQRHRRDAAEIVRRDDDGRGLTRIHLRAGRSPRDRHRWTDRVENGNGDRRGLHDVPVRIECGCVDGDRGTWRRGRRHRERKRFGPAGRGRIEDSCRRVLRLAGVCLEAHLCQAHVVAGADIHHNATPMLTVALRSWPAITVLWASDERMRAARAPASAAGALER